MIERESSSNFDVVYFCKILVEIFGPSVLLQF